MSPDEALEWHRIAEERRRQLERMQDRTLYGLAAGAVRRGRRVARLAAGAVDPVLATAALLGRSAAAAPARLRAGRGEAALRRELAALPPAPEGRARRSEVTAVIVTAAQPARLDTLLTALGRLGVATLVVDNAGVEEVATVVARHAHARHIRLTTPHRYSDANERAIAEVDTDWTLLLNDDVAPLDDHWLDRMLVAADAATVAVGAQLVHGRRGPLGGSAVDGTVQHAGVGFVLDGPLARAVHLGRGARPRPVDDVREVPAATAACLLVRTAAHRAVGGLHPGFDYGSEDVDLCLRLAAHGRLRVAMGAVLHHEEGATRLARRHRDDRAGRARRQAANRALLDARHAPVLRRRVVAEAFAPAGPPQGMRVTLAVAGPTPPLLVQALEGLPGVVLREEGPAALLLVTDHRRLPTEDAVSAGVPLAGWMPGGDGRSEWPEEALARLDVLLVATAVAASARVGDPTLPVRVVDDAAGLRDALRDLLIAPRWSVRIGARSGRGADRWGDLPVARVLARELRAHGLVVRVAPRDRWGQGADRSADVTLHLKGRGVAPQAPAQRDVVWVMSHPSEVAPGELDAVDLVIAGSEALSERYRATTTTPVAFLPQAADARRFTPGPADPNVASRVLFVGNTRSVPRPVVLGAVDAGLPLTLIGSGWERYLDPRRVRRDHVPYAELPAWYRSAEVVLNDHWDDMARWGIVSNRVLDALAAGACVVSDEVPGIGALLDDAVATFHDREDVGRVVRALLDDGADRRARAERGRAAVLAAHTWEHRAATLVRLVDALPAGSGEGA